MRNTLLTAAGLAFVAGAALAQTGMNRSQEREAIGVISEAGQVCERIIRSQTIGRIDDGTTLMAVACEGGTDQRYVIQLDNRGNMSYAATCQELAEGTQNQIRCFA